MICHKIKCTENSKKAQNIKNKYPVPVLLKTVVIYNIFVFNFRIPGNEVVVAPDGSTGVHYCYEALSYKPCAEH